MIRRPRNLSGLMTSSSVAMASSMLGVGQAGGGGAGATTNLVFHGDSITWEEILGVGNEAQTYPQMLGTISAARQGGTFNVTQVGQSGSTWNYSDGADPDSLLDTAAAEIDTLLTPTAKLFLFAGTNGLALSGRTGAQEFTDFVTYFNARITAGWTASQIYVLTCLPRAAISTERAAYNTALAGGVATYGYTLIDLRLLYDAEASNNDSTWYNDTIHPNAALHDQIAEYLYDAVFSVIWTPAQLASTRGVSLLEHWDALDASTITLRDGNITNWASRRSGSSMAVAQATAASRPSYLSTGLNNQPAVNLAAAARTLGITSASVPDPDDVGFALAISRTVPTTFANTHLMSLRTSAAVADSGVLVAGNGISGPSGGPIFTAASPPDARVLYGIHSIARSRSVFFEGETFRNGLSLTPRSAPAALVFGGALNSNGAISEAVFTTGDIVSVDYRRLKTYLDAKWGSVTTAPAAFTSGGWTVSDYGSGTVASVNVGALPGGNVTAIEYRVNGGTWTSSGRTTPGAFEITGLTQDVQVNVEIRAVNAIGNGATSDTKTVTPTDTIAALMTTAEAFCDIIVAPWVKTSTYQEITGSPPSTQAAAGDLCGSVYATGLQAGYIRSLGNTFRPTVTRPGQQLRLTPDGSNDRMVIDSVSFTGAEFYAICAIMPGGASEYERLWSAGTSAGANDFDSNGRCFLARNITAASFASGRNGTFSTAQNLAQEEAGVFETGFASTSMYIALNGAADVSTGHGAKGNVAITRLSLMSLASTSPPAAAYSKASGYFYAFMARLPTAGERTTLKALAAHFSGVTVA